MSLARPQSCPRAAAAARLAACALLLLSPALYAGSARAQASGAAPPPDAVASASVIFTALGKDGKFVGGLKAEDVRASVDGSPVQVLALRPQTNAPLFLAVVLDTSASQERLIQNTKMAADLFVRGVMEPGADKVAVVTFAGQTVLEQGMTGDVDRVRAAIARVTFVPPPNIVVSGLPPTDLTAAAATGVWDAVWLVAGDVLPRSLGQGRRAMLLVTDGVDTNGRMKLADAVAASLQSEVVAYPIGVGDSKYFDGVDKSPLRKLAEQTGGRAFFPKRPSELTNIFLQISEELSSQYVVTFAAPTAARDGSFHKVKLELANKTLRGAGVELSYPQGYYAGNASTAVRK
ncbi:MAG TPA: VWA domain-containing protein [Pyrinomonadaceae bacterium]|jgi:VWFA-related protein